MVVAATQPAAVTVGDFDTLVAATKLPPATRWADYPADEDDNYLDGLCWRQAPQKPTGRLSLAAVDINAMPSSASRNPLAKWGRPTGGSRKNRRRGWRTSGQENSARMFR